MKALRVVIASVILSSVILNSLPDTMLDHFHHHEHSSTTPSGQDAFTDFSFDCHIPDVFFAEYDVSLSSFTADLLRTKLNVSEQLLTSSSVRIICAKGRAPPVG